jgi:rSAM/selenodomain-associated transferase 2
VSDAVSVSVIFPVLNEGGLICDALQALALSAGNVSYEAIVVDGDPAGSTVGRITDPGVICFTAPKGRAAQMNKGAARASGNILLFLHADTRLPQNALGKVAAALADERYIGGAFDLGISNPRWIFRLTGWCASVKHRVTRIPYGDQAIFIRRTYFEAVGGYPEIPLMEDVEIMKRIKRRGDRIVILPDLVETSARKWEKDGVLYTIFRNWMIQTMYLIGIPADKLVKYYYKD